MDIVQAILDPASRALAEGYRPTGCKLKDLAIELKRETLDLTDEAAIGAFGRQLNNVDTRQEDWEAEDAILAEMDADAERVCISMPTVLNLSDPTDLRTLTLQLAKLLAAADDRKGR